MKVIVIASRKGGVGKTIRISVRNQKGFENDRKKRRIQALQQLNCN